jgi:hypothetical protein
MNEPAAEVDEVDRIDVCENCGARYKVISGSTIMRDKDFFRCNRCGHLMLEWNGAHTYNFIPLADQADGENSEGE